MCIRDRTYSEYSRELSLSNSKCNEFLLKETDEFILNVDFLCQSLLEMCIRDSVKVVALTIRDKFLFFAFLLYLLYGKEWLFVLIINGNIKPVSYTHLADKVMACATEAEVQAVLAQQ